jgi:hypothetical protein
MSELVRKHGGKFIIVGDSQHSRGNANGFVIALGVRQSVLSNDYSYVTAFGEFRIAARLVSRQQAIE